MDNKRTLFVQINHWPFYKSREYHYNLIIRFFYFMAFLLFCFNATAQRDGKKRQQKNKSLFVTYGSFYKFNDSEPFANFVSPYYLSLEKNVTYKDQEQTKFNSYAIDYYHGRHEFIVTNNFASRGYRWRLNKLSLVHKRGKFLNKNSDKPLLGKMLYRLDIENNSSRPVNTATGITEILHRRIGVGIGAEITYHLKLTEKYPISLSLEVNQLGMFLEQELIEGGLLTQAQRKMTRVKFIYLPSFIVAKIGVPIWSNKKKNTGKRKRSRK